MEIPEGLRELVDRLGQALVQALVTDAQCRDLAKQIQEGGYEVGLMIEATLALHRREEGSPQGSPLLADDQEARIITFQTSDAPVRTEIPEREGPQWSADDRAFLQKFKISLD
jgi:hypothetical protein